MAKIYKTARTDLAPILHAPSVPYSTVQYSTVQYMLLQYEVKEILSNPYIYRLFAKISIFWNSNKFFFYFSELALVLDERVFFSIT